MIWIEWTSGRSRSNENIRCWLIEPLDQDIRLVCYGSDHHVGLSTEIRLNLKSLVPRKLDVYGRPSTRCRCLEVRGVAGSNFAGPTQSWSDLTLAADGRRVSLDT